MQYQVLINGSPPPSNTWWKCRQCAEQSLKTLQRGLTAPMPNGKEFILRTINITTRTDQRGGIPCCDVTHQS